jgi:NitT/TauT family transport system substrate-binding protein
MKLTPVGKAFLAIVILAVLSFVVYRYYGDRIKSWASQGEAGKPQEISKDDFNAIGKDIKDADQRQVVDVSNDAANGKVGAGKLDRPLKVAINTWAGHAPGIVANGGLSVGGAASLYKKKYGLDVEFILIEDPAAKLQAFMNGSVDVMWDTVDSYANEASRMAENKIEAKSILQQDWSRGGDGIVSLSSIKSIEDLKGKKVGTTRFTPSHWLLLYMLSQSGLTPDERNQIEKNLIYFDEAPKAAAAFKAKQVDAAVTWEPDLSAAVTARGDEAHILVSTTAATHVIADTLVARQQIVDQAPKTLQDFVAGWFDGIAVMKEDPQGTNQLIATALKLTPDDVSGMLSGLKLTPFADNAAFYGLSGPKPYFDALFNGAFVIWRKKGVVSKTVDAKDWKDPRFVAALSGQYKDQKVADDFVFKDKPKVTDRGIVNKSLSIHFTTGSDEIMPGSYFTLDALGDTMLSFGNTFLEVEGNTDSKGQPSANRTLSQKRAEAVKAYLVKNFNIPDARFVTVGHGADKPIASNDTEDGRALNRRTDIKVVLNAAAQ